MPWYRNNEEGFGDPGPFDAESKEAFADEMMPTFRHFLDEGDGWDEEELQSMRERFIEALEEVRFYTMSDGVAHDFCTASDMDGAIAFARDSWSWADPSGDYDVTIREYGSEADYLESQRPFAEIDDYLLSTTTITITVE